ncbi:hypothetical protein S7S_15790 [Isoalcanivorax pacificus W11-5]|uniref:DUF3805 domain-containing protein n=1 Tax=Isoalcanivorax pacificus W11-5 TaxID=391936 RepID=A0A0B4XS24_9GAMM|nr:hypothetical protein [Isoalcanivorax pacificus]AJD49570.1 hypothetical protein S7S_15790 [Isoalcanivorax pacificus W11-5]
MSDFNEIGWSLDVPEGWDAEDMDDVALFSNPDGVGVLQVAGMEKDVPVTPEDLDMLAEEQLAAGLRAERVIVGDFRGISFVQRSDEEFWQFWYLAADRLALVITYSCADEDRNEEIEQVREMIGSLALEQ